MAINPFDNFSPKAQAVLTGSYQLLRQYQHTQLEVEHLLMSMLTLKEGATAPTLEKLGVDPGPVKEALSQSLTALNVSKETTETGKATATMFFTPRLQQVFSRALNEKQPPQTGGLSDEHFLLAILRDPNDPATQLLQKFGVDYAKVLQHWSPNTTAETPLTHFNEAGRARMVDVSEKATTERRAIAKGEVLMEAATLALIREGKAKKGDVLAVAQIAGIMAAKKTSELIPMCHPLMLSGIDLRFELDNTRNAVLIEAEVKTSGPTGVEMEALTAVSAAALTIYDMVKATDKGMRLGNIRLTHKSGGKSGTFTAE